jgi:WXG100 family type VII secretion target
MARPPLNVDTDMMQLTGRKGDNIAQAMAGEAQVLRHGLEFVRNNWKGQAGDAFRVATQGQQEMLDRLVMKLTDISGKLGRGGAGIDEQDAGAGSNLMTAQGHLSGGPLNF